jgi:hypothetical protein
MSPQAGGAGDFVANVFVLAQNLIPVAGTILNLDFSQTFLERNTLGMFGSGAIELLGREGGCHGQSRPRFARISAT